MDQLQKILKNQPKYRLAQVKKLIFKQLINNWQEAHFLPLSLRKKLIKNFPLSINANLLKSKNKNTIKAVIILKDGLKIESVLMKYQSRNTVCLSSQVGCSINCAFCATGKMGFKRNLLPYEIINQVLLFARLLKKEGQKINNLVFMGMGEPFLNFDNVKKAIEILADKNGFNFGNRRISISTVGIISGIKKLARKFPQVNLAISLHAPTNALRTKLIPINKKYSIQKILSAVNDYIKKTNRKVMFEYILIKDINDSLSHAQKLAKLLNHPLYFVNLVPYNPTGTFKPSPPSRIKKFKNILLKAGIFTTQRYRFGTDIKAGCGQLITGTKKSESQNT